MALTAPKQITELGQLKQQAAAFLLGINARSLRDWPIHRNDNGTYDARELLRAANLRADRPPIDDDDLIEKLLVVAGACIEIPPITFVVLIELFEGIRSTHGDAGLVSAFEFILGQLRPSMDIMRKDAAADTNDGGDAGELARLQLKIAIKNDKGQIRHGRKWTKRKRPDGYVLLLGDERG